MQYAAIYWVMTVVGAVPGVLIMPKLAGWVRRPRIALEVGMFIIVYCIVVNATLIIRGMVLRSNDGVDIWSLGPYC